MSLDTQKIEYAALQHDLARLNQERYKDDVAIQALTQQFNILNTKVDLLLQIVHDIQKDTQAYQEAEALLQFV